MQRGLFLIACLFLTPGFGRADDDRPIRDKVHDVERHMRQIIDTAEPSVVAVVVSSNPRYPALAASERMTGRLGGYAVAPEGGMFRGFQRMGNFDPKLDLSNWQNVADNQFGSGVVLDADGLILTNYHLVEGAKKIYVKTAAGKGSYADIHAADSRSDLAVLKLLTPPAGMRAIKIAEGRTSDGPNQEKVNITRGMWVVSLGHPHATGFTDGVPSASWGILSNVRRRAATSVREDQRYKPFHQYNCLLQTDARITLGCSGAALLNLDGELIGLSTPIAALTGAETGGGFAIPMDPNYRKIIAVLKQGKEVEYGFLGVMFDGGRGMRGFQQPRFVEDGLVVRSVTPGTPADKAGIIGEDRNAGGDVIMAVDGNRIREQDDLFLYVGAALAGNVVKMTIMRGGQRLMKDVTLAKFPHDMPWIASVRPPALHGLRVDYSSVFILKAENRFLPPSVLVRELEPGSRAEIKFKELGEAPKGGWLITHVGMQAVTTPNEFVAAFTGKTSAVLKVTDPNDPRVVREVILP